MAAKLKMLFNDETLGRVKILSEKNIEIDLHGLKVNEARKFIKNIALLCPRGTTLRIIHGYQHGTAIKEMLDSEKLFNRNYTLERLPWNLGLSLLQVG